MAGPKSDRVTIEARRNRLIELLSEGKTAAEAATVLRSEGFPASHDRVEADIDALLPALQRQNADDMNVYISNQYVELQALKLACHNGSIKPDRAIELLLGIMDREMKLLGTAAPTRSESKQTTVKVSASPESMRTWQRALYELRNIREAKLPIFWERVRPTIAELEEHEVIDASYYPEQKGLADGTD
jgi:hypothetical protein